MTAVEEKQKEIDHYEGVMDRLHPASRWYDSGRRKLALLRQELKDLQEAEHVQAPHDAGSCS